MNHKLTDKDLVLELELLVTMMEDLNIDMDFETLIQKKELEARQLLDLNEKQQIDHYNSWMKAFGLEHLTVES